MHYHVMVVSSSNALCCLPLVVNHAWAVTRFLNANLQTRDKDELKQQFHLYIILQSHKKLHWRVASALSARFYTIILDFGASDVTRQYRQYFAGLRFNRDSKPYPMLSDKKLLQSLRKASSWLSEKAIHIPILLRLAQEDHDEVPYTEEACAEFHSLLSAILRGYESFLKNLKDGLVEFKQIFKQKDRKALLAKMNHLMTLVVSVSQYAAHLQLLTYSKLIVTHLDIMAFAFYQEWSLFQRPPPEESDDEWEDIDDDPGDNDELPGLYSNIRSQPNSVCDTFLQWLQLQVKHRIAAERLMSLNLQQPISIEVIDSMNKGNPAESWEKTVRDMAFRGLIEDPDKLVQLLRKIIPHSSHFDGTLHCEAILASLMMLLQDDAANLDEEVVKIAKVSPSILNIFTCLMENVAMQLSLHRRIQAMLSHMHAASAFPPKWAELSCGAGIPFRDIGMCASALASHRCSPGDGTILRTSTRTDFAFTLPGNTDTPRLCAINPAQCRKQGWRRQWRLCPEIKALQGK